jgi:uncharacterized protein (DUF2235 family)
MKRRIVLLSDGTGNSSAKVWRTNVWRVFESLDLSGSDQVAFYDDGVGSSAFKPVALIGGAFGYGLKRNVLDLYKFACRNIQSNDDELFAFGFSRGAFTIRIVVGLIRSQGLVRAQDESSLDRLARMAYRDYRASRFHSYFRIEDVFRWTRDRALRTRYDASANLRFHNVRFLGLWDTVSAYGLPIEEMTLGVSKFIWPLELPDHELNPDVKRACHALSIDEERTTFHPVLWNERNEPPASPAEDGNRYACRERLSQVWFAGVHSNVGGGYPDDSLAHIPLVWILQEAERCGLVLKSAPQADPDAFRFAASGRDKDGRIYDPRSGLGGLYRYGPRNLAQLCSTIFSQERGDEVFIETPKIHESALARIQNAARGYAPLGLPARYEIVTDNGQIVPPAQPYETKPAAAARARAQESAWNIVWKRRVVYFLTIGATIYLFFYPLVHALPRAAEYESRLRWVSDIIRLIGSVLPGAAAPWINGYARSPGTFLVLVAIIALLIMVSSRLRAGIGDEMLRLWKASLDGSTNGALPTDVIYRLRTRGWYRSLMWNWKRHIAPALSALVLVWLGLSIANHAAFIVQDDAGLVCRPSTTTRIEPVKGKPVVAEFPLTDVCADTGVTLERGKTYRISVAAKDPNWSDGGLPASVRGFYASELSWSKWPFFVAGTPLRREWIRPWFRVVARFGSTGGEERFFDPDPDSDSQSIQARVRAPRDGELFFFVNDAVIGLPGLYDVFYRNNAGVGVVKIERGDE